MTDRTTILEERLAYLERLAEDLSDEVARLSRALETAERRIARLTAREAERELDAGGTIPLADQRPPHW